MRMHNEDRRVNLTDSQFYRIQETLRNKKDPYTRGYKSVLHEIEVKERNKTTKSSRWSFLKLFQRLIRGSSKCL